MITVARFIFNEANMKLFEDAISNAVKDVANELMQDSKMQTPIDTKRLHDSAKVDSKELEATVSFDTDYAVYVHENLNSRHPIGNSKFLEKPLDENKEKYIVKMAEIIKSKI